MGKIDTIIAETGLDDPWKLPLETLDPRHIEVVGEPKRVPSNFVMGYETLPVKITRKI